MWELPIDFLSFNSGLEVGDFLVLEFEELRKLVVVIQQLARGVLINGLAAVDEVGLPQPILLDLCLQDGVLFGEDVHQILQAPDFLFQVLQLLGTYFTLLGLEQL
jgi:hypothetical protein